MWPIKNQALRCCTPQLEEAIRDSIAAWNKSSSKKEDLERFVAIYDDAKVEKKRKGPRIAPADYQHCVNFTVFTVALLNSNRKAVLPAVTNGDWRRAKDVYKEVEGGELVFGGNGDFYGKVVTLHPSSGACKTEGNITIFMNRFVITMYL